MSPAAGIEFQIDHMIRLVRSTVRLAPNSAKVDRSKLPIINEADLDEVFISGSGPGGQSVNKAVNCCQIKHRPTGIVVKVHQTRSLETNRKIARELLQQKLDNLYNGDESVQAQEHRLALRKISIKESQAERRRAMKQRYRERMLGQDGAGEDP